MSRAGARRKSRKFSNSARITVAAVSVTGLIGGWNVAAHIEQDGDHDAAVSEATAVRETTPLPLPQATPWPTVAPLASFAPIPTLVPSAWGSAEGIVADAAGVGGAELQLDIAPIAPLGALPTLAPLPALPQLPPPPPPPSNSGGGGNKSGGS